MFGLFDVNYLVLVALPTLILSGLAQMYVRSAYSNWQAKRNTSNMTGAQVGQAIVRAAGLSGVRFETAQGQLSDHYDPRTHVVRLSPDVASRPSVASMAIVAHELGHAQQHAERSALIGLRSFLVPAATISPNVAYVLILLGIVTQWTGALWLGIVAFGVTVAFMLLTLPVEIDASRRGLALLQQSGLMRAEDDRSGSRQVLTAAALTYVAAAVSAMLTLLYYVSLANRSRD